MKKNELELVVKIGILNDDEWEPDMDFAVEIYDPETKKRLPGDDTKTTITILDEDFPGTLGFAITDVRVTKQQERVDITVMRMNGSDGIIQCTIKTLPLAETGGAENNAIEYEDYLPKHDKI